MLKLFSYIFWLVLGSSPAFEGTMAVYAQPTTIETWRTDLAALTNGIEARHLDPCHKVSDSAWCAAVANVHDRIRWFPLSTLL